MNLLSNINDLYLTALSLDQTVCYVNIVLSAVMTSRFKKQLIEKT